MTAFPGRHSARWQLAWGLFLILAGVLLMFDRFYVFSLAEMLRIFWPVALIAFGVKRLWCRSSTLPRLNRGQNSAQSTSI